MQIMPQEFWVGSMSQPSVLILDDDSALLKALSEALRLQMNGVTVDTAHSAAAALDRVAACDYDAIVADIKMAGTDGLTMLAEIRKLRPETPVLIITGHVEHELVVHALRGGAFDFITKPIDCDYFVGSLRRAIHQRQLSREDKERQLAIENHINELEAVVEQRARDRRATNPAGAGPMRWMLNPSGKMERVAQQIHRVADSPLTVLVEGGGLRRDPRHPSRVGALRL
ncbi:MAG: hypothetical protein DMG21_08425 [Acidobacteria bacterium]|nr:MAG: hypothetical protein DMG21_08425 [Acidobacteriota bacterium]